MITNFYFIGCGCVATALIEVFNLEKKFYNIKFVIIEPCNIKDDLLEDRDYIHIKEYLTIENHKELLKDISKNTLVIDLSVELDSIMVIKYVKEKGAMYLNTSIENWEQFESHINKPLSTNYNDFKNETLYTRELIVDELLKNTKTTRIVNGGMNPGGVSELFKLGLKEYARTKDKTLIKGDYARLAFELGLKKISIVECDTQETNIKPNKDTFYNTWSPLGAQSEFADYTMISLNNDDLERLKDVVIKPNNGPKDTHIRFIPIRGMDNFENGITLNIDGEPFEYSNGMTIPHAEIFSLSRFLQYKNDTPTILYIYRVSPITFESTKNFRKNNYKPLEYYYALENKDIVNNGFDSIGTLLEFSNGDRFWAGTVLCQNQILNLGFKYAQSTSVQVAAWLFAEILYMIKYPNEGFNEAETLHSKELYENSKKYLGNCYFKYI